jgi:hypothetical protein
LGFNTGGAAWFGTDQKGRATADWPTTLLISHISRRELLTWALIEEAAATVKIAMAHQKLAGIDASFATQFGMPVLNDEEVHRGHLKERLDMASNRFSSLPIHHLHYF